MTHVAVPEFVPLKTHTDTEHKNTGMSFFQFLAKLFLCCSLVES